MKVAKKFSQDKRVRIIPRPEELCLGSTQQYTTNEGVHITRIAIYT